MTKLPKTSYEYHSGPHGYFVIGKWKLVLPREMAKELHRIVKAYPGLMELLRYFYELPASGARNQSEHVAMLKLAEQALKEQP